jgi:hypothetical protein
MPPEKLCNPETCPTGIQLGDVKKSLDDTSRLYIRTHDSMTEVITTMKLTAEASAKREANVDKDIDSLFSLSRQADKKINDVERNLDGKIAKKIELSTLLKGATLVSVILGMILAILRLAGVV